MIVTAGRKPGDAAYASWDAWSTASDIPEADVPIPLGPQTLWLRVRGLSLAEEHAAFRAARAALIRQCQQDKLPLPGPDECDDAAIILETLQRGVISPRLTAEQAKALGQKNGHLLDQLYRLIKQLSRLTPGELDGIVDEILRQRAVASGLPPAADDGDAGDAGLVPPGQ